jgi:hypothetical protein
MQPACRIHHETLILDATGALTDDGLRRQLETHLATCSACRAERGRLVRLIAKMRDAAAPAELSGAETHRMAMGVLRRLRQPTERRVGVWLPWLAPAAAGLVLLSAASVYYFQDHVSGGEKMADLRIEDHVPLQDVEVIRQLDFLRNWDTIEKLVHAVDVEPASGGAPKEEDPGQSHGARSTRHAYERA